MTLTAWFTHSGFFRLIVPIGMCCFTAGIMLGKVAPYAELAQTTVHAATDMTRTWADTIQKQVRHAPIFEDMRVLNGVLLACALDSIIVAPPPSARSGADGGTGRVSSDRLCRHRRRSLGRRIQDTLSP